MRHNYHMRHIWLVGLAEWLVTLAHENDQPHRVICLGILTSQSISLVRMCLTHDEWTSVGP